jgi:hypothetical protein
LVKDDQPVDGRKCQVLFAAEAERLQAAEREGLGLLVSTEAGERFAQHSFHRADDPMIFAQALPPVQEPFT